MNIISYRRKVNGCLNLWKIFTLKFLIFNQPEFIRHTEAVKIISCFVFIYILYLKCHQHKDIYDSKSLFDSLILFKQYGFFHSNDILFKGLKIRIKKTQKYLHLCHNVKTIDFRILPNCISSSI